MQTLNSFLMLGLLGGQKHSTGWAKIATGWVIAHPVNMLSEALPRGAESKKKKTKKKSPMARRGISLSARWQHPSDGRTQLPSQPNRWQHQLTHQI